MHFENKFPGGEIDYVESQYEIARILDLVRFDFKRPCKNKFCGAETNWYDSKFKVFVCSVRCRNYVCGDLDMKATKFSLVKQTWKGQKVIREGPSRTIFRLFLDTKINGGSMHFAIENNPIIHNITAGSFVVSTDKDALNRGKKDEDKDYLKPEPGSFWNDTKNTPSEAIQLDSGNATFLEDGDTFKKILFNGKRFKGVYVFKRQEKSDLWNVEKSVGPGGKIKFEKNTSDYPYPKPKK